MSQTKAQLISDLVQALNFTGTASAPANGAFLSAANTLALATNSAQRLTINSSGNIGIGTTNPSRKLHLVGSNPMVLIEGSGGNGRQYALASSDDTTGAAVDGGNPGTFAIYDDTANAARLVINASGNVGIGTTSPRSKLDVDGSIFVSNGNQIQITGTGSSKGLQLIGQDDGTSLIGTMGSSGEHLLFRTASSERMRITTSGNIGIGTTSPTKPSSSNTNTRFMEISSADGADLILGNSATSVSPGDHVGTLAFKNVDPNPDSGVPHYAGIRCESANTSGSMDLRFYVGRGNLESDATNMIISSSGNVGIGTTSPDVDLHVSGGSSVGKIESTSSAASARLIIKSANDTYTGVHFGDDADEDVGRIRYYHNTDHMQFSVGATERMRIDSSGRLLLGTTTGDPYGNRQLTVNSSSGTTAIELRSATNGDGRIVFTDNTTSGNAGSFKCQIKYLQSSDDFIISSNGDNERFRIDSSGKLGIGTTTIGEKLTIGDGDLKFFHSNAGSAHRTTFIEFGNSSNRITSESGFGSQGSSGYAAGYKFTTKNYTGSAFETLTPFVIQANGNVGIGNTSPNDKLVVNGTITQVNTSTSITSSQLFFNNDTSGGQYRVRFDSNNSTVGSISVGTSSTAYNTSSDYRLKENITSISDGITRLKTLIPRRFNWKSDSSTIVDGFIAHEVTAVPEAVTGTKDEVATEDSKEAKKGDPIYQQIDQSKLVPLLVAAVQELITKVETLEAA